MTVEGAEGPAKTGDCDRCTEARADSALRATASGKMCGAHAGRKSQPGKRFEFFVEEESGKAAGRRLTIREGCLAGIATREVGVAVGRAVEEYSYSLIVVLVESKKANLQIVPVDVRAKTRLASGIGRGMMVGCGGGIVVQRALIVGGVSMKQRRDREQEFRVESMDPGNVNQGIGFAVAVTQAAAVTLRTQRAFQIIEIRIVRNLVIVLAQRGHEAQLVGRIDVENQ